MDGTLFEKHVTADEIAAAISHVLDAPKNGGILEMIVRRPKVDRREVLEAGVLETQTGLVGDNWSTRGSSRTPDRSSHPDMQLNVMNIRFAELIAGSRERVPLAGDQLFVDLDLSSENLPPGTQLAIGEAVIEVTAVPHLGCKKFVARFGLDAMKFANSDFGRRYNLRGINARVIKSGRVTTGDAIQVRRPDDQNRLLRS